MKKRIFKRNPQFLKKNGMKKMSGVILVITTLVMSVGMILPVHGEESSKKSVVTEIYHKHIGSSGEKGGCYQQEIPHIHQGNEKEGGACYQREVRHTHQGDESAGTGCYSKVIYHTHQGDGQSEEGCYGAVYHTHEESCYKNKICTIRYTKGNVIGSETKECDAHGQSVHERAEGIGSHVNCSIGDEEVYLEYCRECGIMSYSYHDYQELVCGKNTEEPEDYELTCGKDETTVEGYETECGLEQGNVEKYELSCDKKTDGYARNCGLDEKIPVGKMILTNETQECSEKVTVSVRIEDLSGGKLLLDEPPFVWYDETGKCIGNGGQIEVDQNGSYTAEVKLKNPDVDESGLRNSITVDNVFRQEGASPSPEDKKSPEPSSSAKPTPSADGEKTPGKEQEESPSEAPQQTQEPSDADTAQPLETPSPRPLVPSEDGTDHDGGDGEVSAQAVRKPAESEDTGIGEDASGEEKEPEPVIKKEVKKEELKENMTSLPAPVEMKKIGFWQRAFADPVVRIFTVAVGTLLLLTGIFFLLLYLLRSVRIYNDDGQGRFIKLGRFRVRLEEEGYAVTISEKAAEKAYTNRYCMKPGLFRIGKDQQEILVYKDTKRVTVSLEKEMIFMI